MARVEEIRRLEFESTPTLTVAAPEAFREQVTGGDESVPEDRRAFANATFEALLMVNESADALAVQRRNRGATVGGFYAPREDTIVMTTDDIDEARIDGGVPAHELVHALQDQHFDAVGFPGAKTRRPPTVASPKEIRISSNTATSGGAGGPGWGRAPGPMAAREWPIPRRPRPTSGCTSSATSPTATVRRS